MKMMKLGIMQNKRGGKYGRGLEEQKIPSLLPRPYLESILIDLSYGKRPAEVVNVPGPGRLTGAPFLTRHLTVQGTSCVCTVPESQSPCAVIPRRILGQAS